jgi:hypothetical protein
MTAASRQIARRIAIRATMTAKGDAPAPARRAPQEPIEIKLDLSNATLTRAVTKDGVPYAKFTGGGRTVMAFGEIATVASESMRADGYAVENGSTIKIVAIRPFETRDTLVDELGDEYVPAIAA